MEPELMPEFYKGFEPTLTLSETLGMLEEWSEAPVAMPLSGWAFTIQQLYNKIGYDWYFRLRILLLMRDMYRVQVLAYEPAPEAQAQRARRIYANRVRFVSSLLVAVLARDEGQSAHALALADAYSDVLSAVDVVDAMETASEMLNEWPRDYQLLGDTKLWTLHSLN